MNTTEQSIPKIIKKSNICINLIDILDRYREYISEDYITNYDRSLFNASCESFNFSIEPTIVEEGIHKGIRKDKIIVTAKFLYSSDLLYLMNKLTAYKFSCLITLFNDDLSFSHEIRMNETDLVSSITSSESEDYYLHTTIKLVSYIDTEDYIFTK